MFYSNEPMPTSELSNQSGSATSDESLVNDVRAGVTPAQIVERKLFSMLNSTPLPTSRLMATRVPRPGN